MTNLASFRFDSEGNIIEHDLQFNDNGELLLVNGKDELRERIICTLLFPVGDSRINATAGVPYVRSNSINDLIIHQRPISESLAGYLISKEILNLDGVLAIRSIESVIDRETRNFNHSIEVDTIFGSISI